MKRAGLYCILALWHLVPISADSPVTWHAKVTCPERTNQQPISASDSEHGETAEGSANCDPNASAAQTVTETAQYEALATRTGDTTVNQSGPESGFLEEMNNEHSVSAAHASCCNKQGLQQDEYFNLNNRLPWNNQDYEDALGFRLPYNQMTDRSVTHSSPEDTNRMSDTYFEAPDQLRTRLPRAALPINTNLIWQAPSLSGGTRQDSQGNSADEELEPPQVKKNVLTPGSWGANGMPFNVLYLSSRQHKKPVQKPPVARAERVVVTATLRDLLSRAVAAGSNGGGRGSGGAGRASGGAGGRKSPPLSRWYYSVIPQLHATYGWRQHGK